MGFYNAMLHTTCPWTENVSPAEQVSVLGEKVKDVKICCVQRNDYS